MPQSTLITNITITALIFINRRIKFKLFYVSLNIYSTKTNKNVKQKVKLSILGISFRQVQEGAYALIFAEENSIRRLPIVIGAPEAQSIAIVMEGIKPPRPLTHDLLHNVMKTLNINLLEVYIYKFEDGAFFSELILKQNDSIYCVDSRTSDAVALAIRTQSPIYTTESIMQKMGIVFEEHTDEQTDNKEVDNDLEWKNTDYKELSTDILQKKLQEALEEENYEIAIQIRDEINSRKKES